MQANISGQMKPQKISSHYLYNLNKSHIQDSQKYIQSWIIHRFKQISFDDGCPCPSPYTHPGVWNIANSEICIYAMLMQYLRLYTSIKKEYAGGNTNSR